MAVPERDPSGDSAASVPTVSRLIFAAVCGAIESTLRSRPDRSAVPHLTTCLAALRADGLPEALREVDRAWRLTREDSEELAWVYGLALALDGAAPEAWLRLLRRVRTPDAEVQALMCQALLRLDRFDEAQRLLHSALQDVCVAPEGLLMRIADEVVAHPDNRAAGWLGRTANLDFVGRLVRDEPLQTLEVRLGSGTALLQPIQTSLREGHRDFHFQRDALSAHDTLEVSCRHGALIGGTTRAQPRFGLDGRADSRGSHVQGWVRLNWLAGQPVRLRLQDEAGHSLELPSPGLPRSFYRWPFEVDLRRTTLTGARLTLAAQLPTGDWQPMPAMPLLLERAVRLRVVPQPLKAWKPSGSVARGPAPLGDRPPVEVIIPVYRGRDESLACIEAACSTAGDARVVVVDDATPDPELAAALDGLARNGSITLLRNARNLGFVGAVNRGMARSGPHDVVLLNADARVFGDWLARLQAAAYRDPSVGTVTPFSNAGSIASYPRKEQGTLSIAEAAHLDQLTAATHAGIVAEIPVGVGFCLYIKRACLDQVGEFDAAVFGKGYGEETDFCLRARRRGWSHVLAADVFVHHAGAGSFGAERDALLDRSHRLINLRHPGYDQHIAGYLKQDPLRPLRRTLDEQRLRAFPGRFVLLVTLALSGGVARFVAQRCRELRAQGCVALVLRPCAADDPRRCELWTDALEVPNLQYDIPQDLEALTGLLRDRGLEAIEIQHFLHLDARVIEAVRALGPYEVFVHDYAWICPRVTLIDGSGRYCGEPAVATCERCVKRNGSELAEAISVAALRERSAGWLRAAWRVRAPSSDAAQRLRRYADVEVLVQPHSPPTRAPPAPARASARDVLRIALIGAIGDHKGYRVLRDCARDAQARRLPLEFVVVGYTVDDQALLRTGKVFITGRFGDGEVGHLLRREQPGLAFIASVCPETYSYVLDDVLEARLPVVAFDVGAVAERLRAADLGTLLPLDLAPADINDEFLRLARQPGSGTLCYRKNMSTADEKPKVNAPPSAASGASNLTDALSASVQVLPLGTGLYLFSVKTAGGASADAPGQLRLPAMHVGLGPGVSAEQVDFLQGPRTTGAWLFTTEDYLVTKVNGAGATLVLTSVRGLGGETLSIKIERLDARADAVAAAPLRSGVPLEPPAAVAAANAGAAPAVAAADAPLPLEITAHIRSRGDVTYTGSAWAGRVAPGLWIESFSVKPLQQFEAGDIEYKGLTGSGFETPWLSDAAACGTRGMAVPLLGFAIRLKRSATAAAFDCEYSGYFKSGVIVGPLRNGAPCRSTAANDPLEGIQVHVRRRLQPATPANNAPAAHGAPPATAPAARAKLLGPSFGRYRDANQPENAAPRSAAKPAARSSKRSARRR